MKCTRCPGEGIPLSTHGRLRWYTCNKCGVAFSNAPPPRIPHPTPQPTKEPS